MTDSTPYSHNLDCQKCGGTGYTQDSATVLMREADTVTIGFTNTNGEYTPALTISLMHIKQLETNAKEATIEIRMICTGK